MHGMIGSESWKWEDVFTPFCALGFSWQPQTIGLPIDPTWLRPATVIMLVYKNKF